MGRQKKKNYKNKNKIIDTEIITWSNFKGVTALKPHFKERQYSNIFGALKVIFWKFQPSFKSFIWNIVCEKNKIKSISFCNILLIVPLGVQKKLL